MAGFSGATGVPLKQMQDAIAQSTANMQYGETPNSSAITANTMTEISVTYPTAYQSVAFPVVSVMCWTDPSTLSWVVKTRDRTGFVVRVKSTNNLAVGDLTIEWVVHGI